MTEINAKIKQIRDQAFSLVAKGRELDELIQVAKNQQLIDQMVAEMPDYSPIINDLDELRVKYALEIDRLNELPSYDSVEESRRRRKEQYNIMNSLIDMIRGVKQ